MGLIMSDIKYTSSGKKVRVVGKLNTTDFIVQEIYVDEQDNELPAGENFIEKSLLDTPAKTFQQRQNDILREKAVKLENDIDIINNKINKALQRLNAISEHAKQADCILKNLDGFDYNHFCDVFTGQTKYAVTGTSIESFENAVYKFERRYSDCHFDSIRLISLLGNSKGSLDYKVSYYSDGSGGGTTYKFVNTIEEAAKLVFEVIDRKIENHNDISYCLKDLIKHNINIPDYILTYNRGYQVTALNERRESILKLQQRAIDDLNKVDEDLKSL